MSPNIMQRSSAHEQRDHAIVAFAQSRCAWMLCVHARKNIINTQSRYVCMIYQCRIKEVMMRMVMLATQIPHNLGQGRCCTTA
jgi:hypothetical protein